MNSFTGFFIHGHDIKGCFKIPIRVKCRTHSLFRFLE